MIGFLNAYHFDFSKGSYQEQYTQDMITFLEKAFQGASIREYKIAKGEWPGSTKECQVWVICGSAKSAYEDVPWIHELSQWVKKIHEQQEKLIGICFGHQLIAHALGGKTEKSEKGWGVGVKPFTVIKEQAWMNPKEPELSLIFSHQDQVTKLPDEAILLARSEFCPNQMFQIGNHILTMQGHPEFTPQFAQARLDTRKEKIGADVYEVAVASLKDKCSDEVIAQWLKEFSK